MLLAACLLDAQAPPWCPHNLINRLNFSSVTLTLNPDPVRGVGAAQHGLLRGGVRLHPRPPGPPPPALSPQGAPGPPPPPGPPHPVGVPEDRRYPLPRAGLGGEGRARGTRASVASTARRYVSIAGGSGAQLGSAASWATTRPGTCPGGRPLKPVWSTAPRRASTAPCTVGGSDTVALGTTGGCAPLRPPPPRGPA